MNSGTLELKQHRFIPTLAYVVAAYLTMDGETKEEEDDGNLTIESSCIGVVDS
jgi:hypothetical protein